MKKTAYVLLFASVLAVAVTTALSPACKSKAPDMLLGAWKPAYQCEGEKGYSFYSDGRMFRYSDKCAPLDSTDKHYTYYRKSDSVFISWPGGSSAWAVDWIDHDFIRVRERQAGYLSTFYLERDYWGK